MTIKEIAEAVQKDKTTVQRWVKKLNETFLNGKMHLTKGKMHLRNVNSFTMVNKLSSGSPENPSDFTIDETLAIIECGLGSNAATMFKTNLAQIPKVPSTNVEGSTLTERDISIISQIVATVMSNMDARVKAIETRVEQRAALLPAPHIKPRDHINQIVRKYAARMNMETQTAWRELYTEFGYRTNSNPGIKARNRQMATIDYIEAEGQMDLLESIALDYMGEIKNEA